MTERDWLVVGAEAVEVDWSRLRVGVPTTVERIGVQEVRCADGTRYSASWLAPVGANSLNTAHLVSAVDPRVAEVRGKKNCRDLLERLSLAVYAVRQQPSLPWCCCKDCGSCDVGES